MKGITKALLTIISCALVISCTDMDPKVKFDAEKDAKSFTKVGNKDLKAAEKFWDKVEKAYTEKGMEEEYLQFEELIAKADPNMINEITLNREIMGNDVTESGREIEYDPETDAATYIQLLQNNADDAVQFLNDVRSAYNEDGYYEELDLFESLIK